MNPANGANTYGDEGEPSYKEANNIMLNKSKRLVKDFFGKVSQGDLTGALAMIHDDVAIFSERLRLVPRGTVADGDRVAVELSGHAVLKDGRNYDNLYHVLLKFEDGQIIAAREYHDTLYAKIVLIDGQVSNSLV